MKCSVEVLDYKLDHNDVGEGLGRIYPYLFLYFSWEYIDSSNFMSRKHFHTFDALRFFSFFLVFLHHTPHNEDTFSYYFSKSGGIGVSFFFVLSGFLITYILLYEKEKQGMVSLKNFFVRRILRIWPLFYAMILFAFLTPMILDTLGLTYSSEGYRPNWLASLLFLENYQMMLSHSFPDTSPLRVMWSLCIEEHFYIVWGLTLAFLPVRRVPMLILFSILLANILRVVYIHAGIETLDLFTNIDYFAYGAIPAYMLINRPRALAWGSQLHSGIKYLLLLISLLAVFSFPHFGDYFNNYFSPTLLGILFSSIIYLSIIPEKPIKISDNYWISKLGVFTYGLYLFHTIIINLLLHVRDILPFETGRFLIGIISLALTILMSIVSYYMFEKQFLKLKKYFYN